jgi:hypothetical protein
MKAFFIFSLTVLSLFALCEDEYPFRNQFSIGPEGYHVKRNREGGTWQNGWLGGLRGNYDHIKRCRLYWGIEGSYASGTLDGRTGSGIKIRSTFTDELIEGRLGYTFQSKGFPYIRISPYGGYGYFRETNKFKNPSPLHVKFTTQFNYIAFGFLSQATLSPSFAAGFNLKMKYPWHPKCLTSNDPDFSKHTQLIQENVIWRVELPLTYRNCTRFQYLISPFYENRTYGGRENYPFDFFRTRYEIYGVIFQLIYQL